MAECLRETRIHGPEQRRTRRRPAIAPSRFRGRAAGCRPGASEGRPLELFVGNAGTARAFRRSLGLPGPRAFIVWTASRRMQERPQAALFRALRELGCRVDSPNDKLPAVIYGQGARPGKVPA